MSSTETRSGFKLPWSSNRSPTDEPPADTADAADDAAEAPSEDAPSPGPGEQGADPRSDATWHDPDSFDRPATIATADYPVLEDPAVTPAPAAAAPTTAPARRTTKFMADLSAAMRAAAEAAREQTIAQFEADAKQVVGTIHERSAVEATALRKRADEDIAGVRDWSKAEIARIREETDARIARRKESLEAELGEHAGSIERRIEAIHAETARFEREMAAYFEQLFAETDPSAFAALAARMPEPPALLSGADLGSDETETSDDDVELAETPEASAAVSDATAADDAAERDAIADAATEASAPDGETAELVATETDADAGGSGFGTGFAAGSADEDADGVELDADAVPVDRSAIVAALEAAAEAVVAAEAAAESASQAEESADLAETAAELLSSRIDEGEGWGDLDAAEAEAAFAARMDAGGVEPGSFVDRLAGLTPRTEIGDGEPRTTQVTVTGLVSVASIASFKRHLARVTGVTGVTVSSGPDGEFLFTATHDPSVSFRDVVPGLPGFGARVTNSDEGAVTVTAHDPESQG